MSVEVLPMVGACLVGAAAGAATAWAMQASKLASARAQAEGERRAREEAAVAAERERAALREAAERERASAQELAERERTLAREAADALRAERESALGELAQERRRREQEQAQRAQEQAETQAAQARAQQHALSLQERLDAQQKFIEESRKAMEDAFKARSAEALAEAQRLFSEGAKTVFETQVKSLQADSEQKQKAIGEMLGPVREALQRQEQHLKEFEEKRAKSFAGIEEQIRSVKLSGDQLRTETAQLVGVLRRPEQRGRWGELQLRNCVELAGMTAHCDFVEQRSVAGDGETGTLQPDMLVKLPGRDSVIVVDAKVALDAWLDMLQPGANREQCLQRHAQQVRSHWQGLARKEYWNALKKHYHTPELVVMFVPVESALTAAMEQDPNMHADAMRSHVLIVTPTLLVALLRSIAYGWQQQELAANAERIAEAGAQVYDRLRVFAEHLEKVGGGLQNATRAYNEAIGSLEHKLLPAAREMQKLHVTVKKEMPEIEPLSLETRPLRAPELTMLEAAGGDGAGEAGAAGAPTTAPNGTQRLL